VALNSDWKGEPVSIVKLSLNSIPIAEKIQFARMVADRLELNAEIFPEPPFNVDSMADLIGTLVSSYNAAQMARQDAREKTTLQDDAEAAVDQMLTQSAAYVQNVSAGEASLIELVGMSVRNPGRPIGELPAPAAFSVKTGEADGEMFLQWEKTRGARSYYAEHAPDSPSLVWTRAAVSTKVKATVTGLNSGTRYWFRVAAVGAAGQGTWSDAIDKIAP
jgi:hypothetical protein